ncbi:MULTISPECIES: MotA/TolQ/ExbB proton channel family protein [unclassified Agarivorans]|uniref:MotA/TolQ/ExbB proton channel family protein n=1 Tax=unclassified Agarivorans TaxID=2636026 RepID=UPI0026E11804|nr:MULTISPECIES: MotA/TolQ/ExbB proton channel family protein [unclassified Agarivorans]MDO6685314.1 MotA/TolQ/ExbB proton channel family protein [Agarivorans sp. 3_MG-2023]MDO6715514.1 MotA/TolQ/ExbB proton channel family protein [Agarivorans sp. 2_MG-2023]
MNALSQSWQQAWLTLGQLLYSGGWVLVLLLVITALLSSLLLERYWFRFVSYPQLLINYQRRLTQQQSAKHLQAAYWLSLRCDMELKLNQHLSLIKSLVGLCPLIGLLGTVTGMIHVFDTMALAGSSDPKLMSAGIARATLPTMAGMSIALIAVINFTYLKRWSSRSKLFLQQRPQHLAKGNS